MTHPFLEKPEKRSDVYEPDNCWKKADKHFQLQLSTIVFTPKPKVTTLSITKYLILT